MSKTLEALLRGYVVFKVNDKWFFTYNRARNERIATTGDVEFTGFHIFKGWTCFFIRFEGDGK